MMKKSEIIDRIIELEAMQHGDDAYLDEGEQSELRTLYGVLGRPLTIYETGAIARRAKILAGEEK